MEKAMDKHHQGGICRGGHVLVTEFQAIALNGLFCTDLLQPHDRVPSLTLPTNTSLNITEKYLHPNTISLQQAASVKASLQCFDTVGWATGRASGL